MQTEEQDWGSTSKELIPEKPPMEQKQLAPPLSPRLFKSAIPPGYQRSAALQNLIDQNFAELTQQTDWGYLFTGATDYTFSFFAKIEISISTILDIKVARASPVRVLDIGAGDFQLVESMQKDYGKDVKMYGIGASYIYRERNKIIDEYHVINNAENLSTVFAKQSFDLMVSRATFIHFLDPIGSLCEAYQKLAPGGTLIIDILPVPGCKGYMQAILDGLRKKSYLIVGQAKQDEIAPFFIQKPKDGTLIELIFPVVFDTYSELERIKYKPQPEILKTKSKKAQSGFYPKEILNIFKEARKINAQFFEQHTDLPHLFHDAKYQKLTVSQQFIFILAIHARSMNKRKYSHLLWELQIKADESSYFKIMIYDAIEQLGGSFLYGFHKELSSLEAHHQLNCIHFAAEREIRNNIRMQEVLEGLKQLRIPFQDIKHRLPLENDECLQFPKIAEMVEMEQTNLSLAVLSL